MDSSFKVTPPSSDINRGSTLLLSVNETNGPAEIRPKPWQYIALALAMAGVFSVYGAAPQVLLPEQVSTIVGSGHKVTTLGLLTGIAAILAGVAQPIAGFLSDRTHSRLGRRNSWVLGGSIVSAFILLLLAHAPTIPLLIILWCAMQASGNAILAALTAAIYERFPISRRGTISSISGIGATGGIFIGITIAGLSNSIIVGYLLVTALMLTSGLLYALTAREPVCTHPQAVDIPIPAKKFSLPRSADYWWAFAGRFVIFLGFTGIQSYSLYILTDYIHLGQTNPSLAIGTAIVITSGISTVATLLSMAVSGWISDKLGRLKPFVFWASLSFIVPIGILLIVPSWPAMLITQLLSGLSFGLYLAVDQALMTRVLPRKEDAARDLGILNIANAGPQALAPFIGSIIIASLGGYRSLYTFALISVVIGAFCVRPIRSVR